VSRLLCYNPETRLNAQQALAHPFLEGVSISGSLDLPLDSSPMRGARGAQEIAAYTSAFIEELGAKQGAFDPSFLSSLEGSLLAAIKAAGVSDDVLAGVGASVHAELKSASATLERRRQESLEAAARMQQRVVQIAAEAAPSHQASSIERSGPTDMEVDGMRAERERLLAAVTQLNTQLESSNSAHAKTNEQLRAAQLKVQQLEAERALKDVAITNDSPRGPAINVSMQVRARERERGERAPFARREARGARAHGWAGACAGDTRSSGAIARVRGNAPRPTLALCVRGAAA
jgi:prefoldin subunit 5